MFNSKKTRMLKGLSSIPFFLITLSGCQDFSQVGALGKRSEFVQKTSLQLGNNYYESCENRAKLPDSSSLEELENDLYFFPAITITRQKEIKDCKEKIIPISQKIIELNNVLAIYLQKLATLADKKTGEIKDSDANELNSKANNLLDEFSRFNSNPELSVDIRNSIPQAITILDFMLNVVSNKTKKDAIVPTMICTDDEIRTYIERLEKIANSVYINYLDNERTELNTYYTRHQPITNSNGLVPQDALSLIELDKQYNENIDDLENRKKIGLNFALFLEETRKTHSEISQEFANNFDYGSAGTKEKFCQNYEAQAANIDISFELDRVQVRKITMILKKYQANTEHLIE